MGQSVVGSYYCSQPVNKCCFVNMLPIVLALLLQVASGSEVSPAPRFLDQFSTGFMMEDGNMRGAAPECAGLGWVYYNGHCYLFDSVHTPYLAAEEKCNEVGGYLADILDKAESDFVKSVLNVVNPKDGTDYWLGGLDADRDKGLQWISGAEMVFTDFKQNEPAGSPYLHMNFDAQFKWDTKDDANDKDNKSDNNYNDNTNAKDSSFI